MSFASATRRLRPPGLFVLLGIVAIGMGTPAYFHYKAPRLKAELQARVAAAPKTLEGRVEAWHLHGGPQIHHRLTNFGRWSEELPWLITHAVERPDGRLDLYGVDCTQIAPGTLTRIEALTVVVELPYPRLLGTEALTAGQLTYVPVYAQGVEIPDPAVRLEGLCRALLKRLPDALEKDIEGARLEFRVSPAQAG